MSEKEEILIEQDGLVFSLNDKDNTLILKRCESAASEVIVPSQVNGAAVTGIGALAFNANAHIESVVLPEGIIKIGKMAFFGCDELTEISIPGSVTEIGESAFRNCFGLRELRFADNSNLRLIAESAFLACRSLTSLTLPDNLVFVEEDAFALCTGLESVTLGKELEVVASHAFKSCESLQTIKLLSVSSLSFGTADAPAFEKCSAISELIIDSGVKRIGAYLACGLETITKIKIPDGVLSVGDGAFSKCGIDTIELSASLESIGASCFEGCTALKSILISDPSLEIGNNAFVGTKWYNDHSDGLVYIGSNVYKYKGTPADGTAIVIEEGTTGVCGGAFDGCRQIVSVSLPKTIDFIGAYAFRDCDATILWDDGAAITALGAHAFAGYRGDTIVIPESVAAVGEYAFEGCSAEILWHEACAITTLGKYSLYGYRGDDILIPSSVKRIESYALADIDGIIIWSSQTKVEYIGDHAFEDYDGGSIVIPDSVRSIGAYCFNMSASDVFFRSTSSLEAIGDNVYSGYRGSQIIIPASVSKISDTAFAECDDIYLVTYAGTKAQLDAIMPPHILTGDLEYATFEYEIDLDELIY